ncbi:hypothetical protein RRG08_042385 [Elysia crispata]|uniref:Uncharacterized protein n=1 Tax=Elysia crispata TaxID=231223 RepID=A0AAE1DE57_9GAST|nr:hypothetical protein RRG08_042385 [Elysia crispata]
MPVETDHARGTPKITYRQLASCSPGTTSRQPRHPPSPSRLERKTAQTSLNSWRGPEPSNLMGTSGGRKGGPPTRNQALKDSSCIKCGRYQK